jgi:hypothetical protein
VFGRAYGNVTANDTLETDERQIHSIADILGALLPPFGNLHQHGMSVNRTSGIQWSRYFQSTFSRLLAN